MALPAYAAEMDVSVELPRKKHRPYVAIWLEQESKGAIKDLAVWHEGGRPAKRGDSGKKKKKKKKFDEYLSDLRVWWRAGGREAEMPADGISGATRAAGQHVLTFRSGEHPLGELEAGTYTLVVEAAREDGDDETLRLSFQWPPSAEQVVAESGQRELGDVRLSVRP